MSTRGPHTHAWSSVCSYYFCTLTPAPSVGYGSRRISPRKEIDAVGSLRRPSPAKLFCALLLAPAVSLSKIEAVLEQHFGAIVLRSQILPFTQTAYYTREMGADLRRLYVAFDPLV